MPAGRAQQTTPSADGDVHGRQRSFAWQLGLLASLLVAVTGTTLGIVGYEVARKIIRSEIHKRLRVVAGDRRELIREFVDRQLERVALIASRTRFRTLIDEYLRGESSETVMREDTAQILADAIASTPDLKAVWFVAVDGRVLTATSPQYLIEDFRNSPGFQNVLASAPADPRYYLGEPFERDGQLLVQLSAPVLIRDGDLLGVLMVELDAERLRSILVGALLSRELGLSGELLLGRRDGGQIRLMLPSRRSGQSTLSVADAPNMLAAIDGITGFDLCNFDGVRVLMHYQPLPFQSGGNPWGLVVTIDADEAYAPLAHFRQMLLTSGIGLLALGLFATMLTARRVTRPISQLTAAVDALADGAPVPRVEASRNDELGRLARSFNSMAQRLHELNTALEDKVAERTAALQYSHAELDRVKTRLELVLSASVRAAVIATGKDGRVTIFNSGAEQLLGYRSSEVVGRQTPVLWLDADEIAARATALEQEFGEPVSGFETFVRKAIDVGYDEQEWTFIRKDGERRLVLLNVTPLLESGELVGFLGVGIDITERKKHERELLEATRAAQAASRAKSQFLANMSHEIRTPLNAVIGLTEVVLHSELNPQQRDHLQTVMASADSLLNVINDILDFSRIEAGRLELDAVPFSVQDTVGDTLKSLAIRADQKGLELACYVDPEVPHTVIGDPGRLRQIMTNLVGNAIKFTERGEVIVGVQIESVNAEAVLRFFVRDTGIGIDPDQIDRLFESFEQVDKSTTRMFGGTGLGLAISRQLVELMDGQISAVSAPGKGSTFHFTARFTLPEGDESIELTDFVPLDGRRVLIVDDNQTNREILELVTQAKQMRPVLADSAGAGLQALKTAVDSGDPFDLLLSDVHMPEVDGFMFVEQVRADDCLAGLPIILLTSAGEPGERQRCRQLAVNEWLTKPVKQSELYEAMLRALATGVTSAGAEVPAAVLDQKSVVSSVQDAVPGVAPLRILLVEDSLPNRKVALALLAGGSHSVTVAVNGREALERLEENVFDVVLMDVQMPEMDGFEATARIRAAEEGTDRHQPIIAMTAHALQGDREKCLAAGMDDYVTKPVRRGELYQVLARVTGRSGLRERVGQSHIEQTVDREDQTHGDGHAPSFRIDLIGPLKQMNGDRNALRSISGSYLKESTQMLARLPELIEADNWFEVRRAAHTVKAAMRMFGVAPAVELGQQLEELAGTENLEGADKLFDRFRDAVQPALQELAQFVETGELPASENSSE
ncbi:response regulator [bacterium]|nr:response regulator [bacterium]